MTTPTEPTLGAIRNRIAHLFQTNQFKPSAPLSSLLTEEEIHAIASLATPDRDHG